MITIPERYRRTKRFGCLRSSKVVGFGTNRKRVCDFLILLVRHINLGPILHRFGNIAGFCAPDWPRPYSTLILGVFPLHQITHVGVSPSRSLEIFGRVIIFEVFHPIWSRYTGSTCHRRTDGQTTYCGITALCVAYRAVKTMPVSEQSIFSGCPYNELRLVHSIFSSSIGLHTCSCIVHLFDHFTHPSGLLLATSFSNIHWCRQPRGTEARAPFISNSWHIGHNGVAFSEQINILTYSFVTFYCINFPDIFVCHCHP